MSKDLVKYGQLVFDRSGYKYHGLIKSFVETLRENKVNIQKYTKWEKETIENNLHHTRKGQSQ